MGDCCHECEVSGGCCEDEKKERAAMMSRNAKVPFLRGQRGGNDPLMTMAPASGVMPPVVIMPAGNVKDGSSMTVAADGSGDPKNMTQDPAQRALYEQQLAEARAKLEQEIRGGNMGTPMPVAGQPNPLAPSTQLNVTLQNPNQPPPPAPQGLAAVPVWAWAVGGTALALGIGAAVYAATSSDGDPRDAARASEGGAYDNIHDLERRRAEIRRRVASTLKSNRRSRY